MNEEVRFLTMQELCIKLRISDDCARRMLKDGKLVGMKLATGEWRIVDPGHKFEAYVRGLEAHLQHVPLLTTQEVSELTGYCFFYIHQLVGAGKLKPEARQGNRAMLLFTVDEVRRFMWERQKIKRPRRYTVKLEQLVRWAKRVLEPDPVESSGESLKDEMYEIAIQIMRLPEPVRSQSLADLYRKLDFAELIVRVGREQSQGS